jgi:hypothetical protein
VTQSDDLLVMRLMQIEHWLATGVAEIGTAALPSFAEDANLGGAFALPVIEKVMAPSLLSGRPGPAAAPNYYCGIDWGEPPIAVST